MTAPAAVTGAGIMAPTRFLDLAFDPLTPHAAEHWLAAREPRSAFAYVVTPNVDHVVRLAAAPADVRAAYAGAALTVNDSRVLSALARLCGLALPATPGSDLVAALFARVLRPGEAVCVIGGGEQHIAALRTRFPRFAIIHHEPPFGLRANPAARLAAARFAADTGARFTLMAVGSPQQELIAHDLARLPDAHGTALCIGASIDFLVGAQRRAPAMVQRAHMEWAWRLATNPGRFARRYLIDGPAILPMVLRWRRDHRRR